MSYARVRKPLALALSTLVVLGLGSWSESAAAPPTPDAQQASGSVEVKVGTYNLVAGMSTSTFDAALDEFLPRVDVAGLQEVNSKDKAAVMAGKSGWSHYRAKRLYGEQNPVMWRTSEFDLVSAGTTQTSPECHIGDELWNKSVIMPHFVTVVRLVHKDTGEKISLVNAHLMPGAVRGGRPVAERPRLVDCYAKELRNTRAVAVAEKAWGQVFVLGDFNAGYVKDAKYAVKRLPYRRFAAVDMASMWATERPATAGTKDNSLMDQVWSTESASSASVEFDITQSDHFPGIAGYLFGS